MHNSIWNHLNLDPEVSHWHLDLNQRFWETNHLQELVLGLKLANMHSSRGYKEIELIIPNGESPTDGYSIWSPSKSFDTDTYINDHFRWISF